MMKKRIKGKHLLIIGTILLLCIFMINGYCSEKKVLSKYERSRKNIEIEYDKTDNKYYYQGKQIQLDTFKYLNPVYNAGFASIILKIKNDPDQNKKENDSMSISFPFILLIAVGSTLVIKLLITVFRPKFHQLLVTSKTK